MVRRDGLLVGVIRSNGPSAVRLVPAVRERLPEVPEASTSDAAQSRFLLFDAVTTFLQRLTAREPHVLVLDDLHWADDATMLLLGHLVSDSRNAVCWQV